MIPIKYYLRILRTKKSCVFRGKLVILIIIFKNIVVKEPLLWQFIQLYWGPTTHHSSRQLLKLYPLYLPSIKQATKTTTAEISYLPQDSLNHIPPGTSPLTPPDTSGGVVPTWKLGDYNERVGRSRRLNHVLFHCLSDALAALAEILFYCVGNHDSDICIIMADLGRTVLFVRCGSPYY